MIFKFSYGNPIQTDAVIMPIQTSERSHSYYTIKAEKEFVFTYEMGEQDIIYGLGEQVRGMNKRGWIYESRCKDCGEHLETERSLYAAHNFFLVRGKHTFGVFIDFPGMVSFDFGYSNIDQLVVSTTEANLHCYIIEGSSMLDIVKQFRTIIGRSYIAPMWAFGYHQSRYSYMNSDEVREVARKHQQLQLPLDAIYLDIDYMERYKDFTYNQKNFGDLPQLVNELQEEQLHLVPIIDAAIKIETGYNTYEEGVKKGYFCKNEDGSDFVAGVWPGKVHFPDVLNTEARNWFGQQYNSLLELGIDGFWNDMNEPAIFYSEENLQKVFERIEQLKGTNLDIVTYFEMVGKVVGMINNPEDYKRFYHNINGTMVRHDHVHNLYGYYMTRAAKEAFDCIRKNKRTLLFSRSSYIGMHRYGGLWTGDNYSWWSHLKMIIQQLPSLNMCGFLYVGADVGGFQGNTTEDLMIRWLSFSLFTPLMRNHSASDTKNQELYLYKNIDIIRNLLQIRYGIIPYLYSEYVKSALNNEMLYKPLSFEYPEDKQTDCIEDQLLFGESLMLTPVYEQNAKGRYVYLPEEMLLVRMKTISNFQTKEMEKGHHYIEIPMDEVVFFIRPNKMMVLGKGVTNTSNIVLEDITTLAYAKSTVSYTLYFDDGYSKDYENTKHYITFEQKQ